MSDKEAAPAPKARDSVVLEAGMPAFKRLLSKEIGCVCHSISGHRW